MWGVLGVSSWWWEPVWRGKQQPLTPTDSFMIPAAHQPTSPFSMYLLHTCTPLIVIQYF